MMMAHRVEAVVGDGGTLTVHDVPFSPGDRVEVIILRGTSKRAPDAWRKLRGSVLRYENPTESVALEDWEALH